MIEIPLIENTAAIPLPKPNANPRHVLRLKHHSWMQHRPVFHALRLGWWQRRSSKTKLTVLYRKQSQSPYLPPFLPLALTLGLAAVEPRPRPLPFPEFPFTLAFAFGMADEEDASAGVSPASSSSLMLTFDL